MSRSARQTRPQFVLVIADDSGSMSGDKARAATEGIQEMILACQARGPAGPDKSYFRISLIKFGNNAAFVPGCNQTPARHIEPDTISFTGSSGGTNITQALEMAYEQLNPYMRQLQEHPERSSHPVPLVVLFSDGEHNVGSPPQPVAERIKSLIFDGDPVVIVAAGVSIGDGERPDEKTLRAIASPECYLHISDVDMLENFIATVASSGMSRAQDIKGLLEDLRGS